ncbi:MAG: sensor domain-containing diguanylate cyclase [Ectothiorhodospiraceae bacterium]|nr:sensor domain-containing diguanylate cyclase [Ectothiorhodospiraceae bacterium]
MSEASRKLDRLTEGLRLSVDIINDILQAPEVELDRMIGKGLAKLGEFTKSDRTYVFRIRDEHYIDNTHEWVADGVSPMREQLQEVPIEVAAYWWEAFDSGGVMYIPDVERLDDGRPEKRILQRQDIKSLLAVPMRSDGALSGFVGYDSVHENREFLPGEIDLIQTVANVISFALEKRDAARMSKLAKLDTLTRLPNRHHFDLSANRALVRSTRTGQYGAVLFLDIDNFKDVNDTYGHRRGDALLCAYAARIRDAIRSSDLAARYSGDEFVVLLEDLGDTPEAAGSLAAELAQRVVDTINRPVQLENGSEPLSLDIHSSMGITLFSGDDRHIADILDRADKAMYLAKNSTDFYKFG